MTRLKPLIVSMARKPIEQASVDAQRPLGAETFRGEGELADAIRPEMCGDDGVGALGVEALTGSGGDISVVDSGLHGDWRFATGDSEGEAKSFEILDDAPLEAARSTDDIRDDEWKHEVLHDPKGKPHRMGWVAWGDSVLVKPFSYAGPTFLADSLDAAAALLPFFG